MPILSPAVLVLLTSALAALAGFVIGLVTGYFAGRTQGRAIERYLAETEKVRQAETDALLDGVKAAFADISFDTTRRAGDESLRLAQATLSSERRLQGQELRAERLEFERRLGDVLTRLDRVQTLIRDLERDRVGKFHELGTALRQASEQASSLSGTTERLALALTNRSSRGQWGERMAEDVLRSAGLEEGIAYWRQRAIDGERRPDFTFPLGHDLVLHMDVKFPFDNWRRALEAEDKSARARHEAAFVRDVRQMIGDVAARGYGDPAAGSLDIALMLIPNERVFNAALALEPTLLDEALKKSVVPVSPMSLMAVLAILRHAARRLVLNEASRSIAEALDGFRTAWGRYQEQADAAQRRLEEASDRLATLNQQRRRALEQAISRLDAALGSPVAPASVASAADEPRAPEKDASGDELGQ